MPAPSSASSHRMGVALLAAIGTVLWIAMGGAVAGSLWAPRFEAFSRHVDVWSVTTGESRAAQPLDGSYEILEPTRYEDGRVFLTAFRTTDREGRVDFEWDSNALQFRRIAALPKRPPLTGIDPTETVTYSPLGCIVVVDKHALPVRWFDGAWHPLALPASGDTFGVSFQWTIRAVDLSDGGVMLLSPHDGAASVAIVTPNASTWTPVWPPPSFDAVRTYSAPDRKVVYLGDSGAWLWDFRENQRERLAGTMPFRPGAAALSLDANHVLVAGGRSEERLPNRAFYVLCASLSAWAILGLALVVLAFRALGRSADAKMLRTYATRGMLVPLVALPLGLALLGLLLGALLGSMNFRM